jgi:molybdate transport system regulatory protein
MKAAEATAEGTAARIGAALGESRLRLLEAIDREGSISRAAPAVPLSYKAAWSAVEAMNRLAQVPLVERGAGGGRRAGTRLTDHGRRLLALLRATQAESRSAMDALAGMARAPGGVRVTADVPAYRRLLRTRALRTSARNQFAGRVQALHRRGIVVDVMIEFGERRQLCAQVTSASVRTLGLRVGSAVLALLKAPAVGLESAPAAGRRRDGRNRLAGTLVRCAAQQGLNEAVIGLGGGHQVVALVARDAMQGLGLEKGEPAVAVFDKTDVILVLLE